MHRRAPQTWPSNRAAPAKLSQSFGWIAAGVLVFAVGCGTEQAEVAEEQTDERIAVTVEVARAARVEDRISATGTIKAQHQALISAETGGRVTEVAVELGSKVSRGATLIRLDPTTASAQVQQAAAAVDQAQAASRLAEAQQLRAQKLHKEGALSDQNLEQAEIETDSRRAALSAAEAGLALAEKALADCTLRAPFAGTVGAVQVELGSLVAPGSPALNLVSSEQLFVSSTLTSSEVGQVREGMAARVSIPSLEGQSFAAHVARIGPLADLRTRNYPVELKVEGSSDSLRSGMMVALEILREVREQSVLVPATAVIGGEQPGIFVLDRGSARLRTVTLGRTIGRDIELRDGVEVGEQVIVLGNQRVRDGTAVRLYKMPKVNPDLSDSAPRAAANPTTEPG